MHHLAETYPAPRDRLNGPEGLPTDVWERVESTDGYVAVGDTDATIYTFSGRPPRVEILVETHDAIVTLRTTGRQQVKTVTIRAGQSWTADVAVNSIVARNATAGLAATCQVIGRY